MSIMVDRRMVIDLVNATMQTFKRRYPDPELKKGTVVLGDRSQSVLPGVPVLPDGPVTQTLIFPENLTNRPLFNGDRVIVELRKEGAYIISVLNVENELLGSKAWVGSDLYQSNSTGTLQDIDQMTIPFQVPASGKVKARYQCMIDSTGVNASPILGVSEDGVEVSASRISAGHWGSNNVVNLEVVIPDLTPGSLHVWTMGFASSVFGNTVQLWNGAPLSYNGHTRFELYGWSRS